MSKARRMVPSVSTTTSLYTTTSSIYGGTNNQQQQQKQSEFIIVQKYNSYQNLKRWYVERINYVRRKTGKPFSIKVSPQLKEILVWFMPRIYKQDDYVFPILTKEVLEEKQANFIMNKRKKLNKYLKRLANEHDIPHFTIYSARHTWATLGKRKGVPTAILQESLGHSTEAITQNYLDSFGNEVLDEWDEVIFG